MSEAQAVKAALEALGWRATVDDVREWCSRQGAVPSASFEKIVAEEKRQIRAALLEASHRNLTEEFRKLNAELEQCIRLRSDQLGARIGGSRLAERLRVGHSVRNGRAMTPSAFREAANRQEAVALLPLRVQVLLAAEWAGRALNVLLEADPDDRQPQHALDAVARWALEPSEMNAAQVATFTARRGGPTYLVGTAQLRAAGAVNAAVRAAHEAIHFAGCAATVAECGRLAVSGSPARSYASLNASWLRLFTTCRQAIGPTVPFDPEWRTSTAVALAHRKKGHSAGTAPTEDNLLVFYLPDRDEWLRAVAQLEGKGYEAVKSFNPYWDERGKTFADPDGYRVVLQNADWPNS